MIVALETTEWKGDYPNHIYYLTDDKRTALAYVKKGDMELRMFKKPMPFDPRNRTFEILDKWSDK